MKYRTQIFIVTITLLGLSTLQSCLFSNCNEIELSKDDRNWANCYQGINSLVFSNDSNEQAKFNLKSEYEDYTTCSKFELGPDVYNYYGLEFSQVGKSNKLNNKICINLDRDFEHGADKECIKSFQVLDLGSSFDNTVDTMLVVKYIDLPTFSSHPIKTYYFEVGDSFSDKSTDYVRSFYWSRQFGLVQYELINGEIYKLIMRK